MENMIYGVTVTVRNTGHNREVCYYGVIGIKTKITRQGDMIYTFTFMHDGKVYNSQVVSSNWDTIIIKHT
jgi:hypothetical protein